MVSLFLDIFFQSTVKWSVCPWSLSQYSHCQRKSDWFLEIDFCVDHVAELSRIFLVEIFLEFLMYDMISSTNRDSVASSLPIFISLISFACIYCFSWYFEGNIEKEKEWWTVLSFSWFQQDFFSSFSLCIITLALGFSSQVFQALRHVLSHPSLSRGLFSRLNSFPQRFFCIY